MKYLNTRDKKSDSLYLIYFLQIKLAIDIASQRYPLIKKWISFQIPHKLF